MTYWSLILAVIVFAAPASAQRDESWIWQSPQDYKPDSQVQIIPIGGSDYQTDFRVIVPGFWYRNRVGPDQRTYTELDFPGLGHIQQIGAPKLPVITFDLAIPTNAEDVRATGIEYGEVYQYEMLVYPSTIPERDHPEGDPEVFMMEEQIYFGREVFPQDVSPPAQIERNGPIPFAKAEFMPCNWNPSNGLLSFASEFTFTLVYEENIGSFPAPTMEMDRMAAAMFDNWEYVQDNFRPNDFEFFGEYLFVYPEGLRAELEPMINQKKARSYRVSEILVESTNGSCEGIRAAIRDWYQSTPSGSDCYVLLVGDVNIIPLCDSPNLTIHPEDTSPTDDLYASPLGDDLNEEVYLGRLSINGAEDLAVQVDKILQYEDHFAPFVDFSSVGLVAHREYAPNKYEGAHESVRTASYSLPPNFTTLYGSDGTTDDDVIDFISTGVGIVAYRGHGSDRAWTGWNTGWEDFDIGDLNNLSNTTVTPVVWSFACNNNEIGITDCLGEHWMQKTDGGAVAHYGATIPSFTVQNHELDRAMFRAVWDLGIVTHGQAIKYAENEMATKEGSDNAWMYLLLGDPEMKIKRNAPPSWTLVVPEDLEACPGSLCEFRVEVRDQWGQPLKNVLVSAWKPAPSGAKSPDEVFANRYTDNAGRAILEISPATSGQLDLVVRDLDGNTFVYGIPVRDFVSAVPDIGLEAVRLSAAPSVASDGTTFQLSRGLTNSVHIELFNTRGYRVRTLDLGPSTTSVRWDGRDDGGRRVPSGVYYARVSHGGTTSTTRVTMVR